MTQIRKKTQNFREFCGKVQRALRTRGLDNQFKKYLIHHIFDDKNWIFSKKQKQSIMRTKINKKFMDMVLLTQKRKQKKSQSQNITIPKHPTKNHPNITILHNPNTIHTAPTTQKTLKFSLYFIRLTKYAIRTLEQHAIIVSPIF